MSTDSRAWWLKEFLGIFATRSGEEKFCITEGDKWVGETERQTKFATGLWRTRPCGKGGRDLERSARAENRTQIKL